MCGIACSISLAGGSEQRIGACQWASQGALARLGHRGPDGAGRHTVDLGWTRVTLGQTRLKIVDQDTLIPLPFRFDRLGLAIAYNGEVYNWKDVRQALGGGADWETKCDVEALAVAFRRFGPPCLSMMNGMWGLIIVDSFEKQIFIARDRAGKKPLYYTKRGSTLYFASEIKALPVPLEPISCPEVDVLEFDCLERTPFKDVYVVPPASSLVLDGNVRSWPDGPFAWSTWWSIPPVDDEAYCGRYNVAVDEAEAILKDAIKIRTADSEVRIAGQLSGGLDSALIQAQADLESLYCVTFPKEGIDNLGVAELASLGHPVTGITFGYEDILRSIDIIAYHLDTPATWTSVCQWFMNAQIAKDGHRVVITGEGADEIAGGYSRYRILMWYMKMLQDPHLAEYRPLLERTFGPTESALANMLDRSGGDSIEHASELVRMFSYGNQEDPVGWMERVDFSTTMQVLVRMGDRMTAAFGLENRNPFLDHRLVEFFFKIPSYMKVNEVESKTILRSIARRWNIHPSIIDEKTKKGLFLPWGKWTGLSSTGTGAVGRESFSILMKQAWKKACIRKAICTCCRN